eukprot:gene13351-7076_t
MSAPAARPAAHTAHFLYALFVEAARRGVPPPRASAAGLMGPVGMMVGMSCVVSLFAVPAGALPPARGCADARHTGLKTRAGRDLSCAQLRPYCAHPQHGERVAAICPATCGICPTGAPYAIGDPSAQPVVPPSAPPRRPPTVSPLRTAAAGIQCAGRYRCGAEARDCGQPCRHAIAGGIATNITCPASGCAVTCDAAYACCGVK